MNAEKLIELYDRVAEAPDAIPRLRRFLLDLAVRGKLVEQDAGDEPAAVLLQRVTAEMRRLSNAKGTRQSKSAAEAESGDVPFPLPVGWAWTRISRLGFVAPRVDADDDSQASFVPMALIPAEYGRANAHEARPWREIKKGYTHLAEGDVGLAKITPCFENGKSAVFRNLTGGVGAGTTELHVVRPVLVNPDYIVLFLKSPQFIETGIPRMTGTAGQKRVPTEYFANSHFPLPPLAEQHRIVARVDELMALLDRLEAARGAREATRDRFTTASLTRLTAPDPDTRAADTQSTLDALPALTTRVDQIARLRQDLLTLALSGRLVPQDPDGELASATMKRITNDISAYLKAHSLRDSRRPSHASGERPLQLPSTWRWVRLADLCRVVTDGDHQPPPRSEDGVAFLTIGNVSSGVLDFAGCRRVERSYYSSLPAYRVPEKGDLLYTVVGATLGRPVAVDVNEPFCVQRHIAILKPSIEMDAAYLRLVLKSPVAYQQALAARTGTAQPTVPLSRLRDFLIPFPPLAEQHRIVAKVDELMALCDRLEAALSTADTTRARLLEALLHEALAPESMAQEAA